MSAPHTLIITDETVMGEVVHELSLSFLMGKISVKDIIIERVSHEVDSYNKKVNEHHYGLVQPSNTEIVLNRFKFKKKSNVDVQKQINIALKAFESNGFFILVGENQVENLSQSIDLEENPSVSFIKLIPLVGG